MGKYVLDGLLGPGGVTETYLAHIERPPGDQPGVIQPLSALKLLRQDRVAEGSFVSVAARFLAAGDHLRSFRRLGYSRVIDLSTDSSSTYIVSEYVSGCDLGRLLETCQAEGRPGVHPVLVGLIGSEIARLLHVGHSAKPVFAHLGLCPQNVIVAASGDVTLLDAGIAASVRAITEQLPERWALVAPELQGVDIGTAGLTDRAAVAADLYALGGLMVLLLTGRVPDELLSRRGLESFDVSQVPDITGKLAAALRTVVSVDPDDRPENAAVLVEWLAGDLVQVRERQRLIAEGVGAAEKGPRSAPPGVPDVAAKSLDEALGTGSGLGSAVYSPAGTVRGMLVLAGGLAAALLVLVGLLLWVGHARRHDAKTQAGPLGAKERRPAFRPDPPGSAAPRGSPQARPAGSLLASVAGHLIVETVPPGAMVWVDGDLKGKTFADIVVGDGPHWVSIIAPGHRMIREVVDTGKGAIIRRTLVEIPPRNGEGLVEVSCQTAGRYPVLLDGEETGALCPAKNLPAGSGRHSVGIYVPPERRAVLVEIVVDPTSKPSRVSLSQ